jgi:HSP20 family protein
MATTDLIPWNRERAVDVTRRRDDPFWSLQREMNRLFEDFGRGFGFGTLLSPESFEPRIDVRETEEDVLVAAEIPGLEEKDFELSLTAEALTIRGEKRREHEKTTRVHRYERSYGAFERSFTLPTTVDTEKVQARFEHGVLSVTLPKAERAYPREIEVKVK